MNNAILSHDLQRWTHSANVASELTSDLPKRVINIAVDRPKPKLNFASCTIQHILKTVAQGKITTKKTIGLAAIFALAIDGEVEKVRRPLLQTIWRKDYFVLRSTKCRRLLRMSSP